MLSKRISAIANLATGTLATASSPSPTKSGPGRRHTQGSGTGKSQRAGSYGRGLRAWANQKAANPKRGYPMT